MRDIGTLSERACAFSPAGISSFFQICDRNPDGTIIKDSERIGARGGGFVISEGVTTEVRLVESGENKIRVFINGRLSPEAETTRAVVEMLLRRSGENWDVTVSHMLDVPIGAGFGSSAAGALGTALALGKALDINLTYNQLGRIAHVAEVECLTGLGTVGPLTLGGCVITTEPGAPGYAVIDRIPVSSDHRVVAGVFKPLLTKEMLSSQENRVMIDEWGGRTLDKIVADPSLDNFMHASKEFAVRTGLASDRVKQLIKLAEKHGAVGAAQNMLGEAVHALVTIDSVGRVVQAFESLLPREKIIVAEVDLQGARLVR